MDASMNLIVALNKLPTKSNSREEGLILALGSSRSSYHGGKTQHREKKKKDQPVAFCLDSRRREKAKSEVVSASGWAP